MSVPDIADAYCSVHARCDVQYWPMWCQLPYASAMSRIDVGYAAVRRLAAGKDGTGLM